MPSTLEAIFVVILLIAPGFFCWTLIGSRIPRVFVSDAHSLIVSIVFSILIHLISLPVTIYTAGSIVSFWQSAKTIGPNSVLSFDYLVFAWLFWVLFFAPVILAFVLSSIWKAKWSQGVLDKFGISQIQSTPEAWDWFFLTQDNGCWVVVEFEDGSITGGEYGKNSFASITPHGKDLYLENVVSVSDTHEFGDDLAHTVGAWINGDKVKALYFYRVTDSQGE